MTRDLQALRTLAQRVMQARDERGVWRPVRACAADLAQRGDITTARRAAEAMARVAAAVRDFKG